MNLTTSQKNFIFVGVLFVIMFGLLIWYVLTRPHVVLPTTATSTPQAVVVSTSSPAVAAHISEHGQYYDADLQYPSSVPVANTTENAAFVAEMKNYLTTTLSSFKSDNSLTTMTAADATAQGLGPDQKYSISNDYKAYYGTHTVSYAFSVYADTLGAHPNTYFKTFTFDSSSGKSISLADLFTPGSDFLERLSTLTRASLVKQLGSDVSESDFIDPGTTADVDNFASFVIDGKNLTILFPPYAVAPYSSGAQSVQIPLSELSTELRAAYK